MDDSAIAVNNQATSRKIVQSNHTVPSAGEEDTYQQNVLLNSRAMSQLMTDANFKREEGTKTAKHTGKNGKEHRISHNTHIKRTDVSTVPVITKPIIALQDNNTRLPLAILLVVQVFTKTIISLQIPHLNIVHQHSNTLNKVSLLLA